MACKCKEKHYNEYLKKRKELQQKAAEKKKEREKNEKN